MGEKELPAPMPKEKGGRPEVKDMSVADFLGPNGLPEKIKGAATVEYFGPKNAKRCLVHIRQTHNEPLVDPLQRVRQLRGEEESEQFNEMRSSQTDIHMILLDLRTRFGPIDVHMEGAAQQSDLLEVQQLSRAVERALKDLRPKAAASKGEAALMMRGQIDEALRAHDAIDLMLLAPGYMAKRGMVRLVPGDDEVANTNANTLLKKMKALAEELNTEISRPNDRIDAQKLRSINQRLKDMNAAYKDWAYAKRENALLRRVQEEGRTIAFTVFGRNHNWQDNIEQWNKEHPTDTFGLVVITPKSDAAENVKMSKKH